MPAHDPSQLVQHVLAELGPEVLAIYLFGSFARGGARDDSDLDIGTLTPAPLDRVRRFEVEQRLATTLHRDVDLVDLTVAPAFLRGRVVAHGRRLMCTDELAAGLFEAHALADYARLHKEFTRAGLARGGAGR